MWFKPVHSNFGSKQFLPMQQSEIGSLSKAVQEKGLGVTVKLSQCI